MQASVIRSVLLFTNAVILTILAFRHQEHVFLFMVISVCCVVGLFVIFHSRVDKINVNLDGGIGIVPHPRDSSPRPDHACAPTAERRKETHSE
jgi:hypothetical protein